MSAGNRGTLGVSGPPVFVDVPGLCEIVLQIDSTTQISVQRYNGHFVMVNFELVDIPSEGVACTTSMNLLGALGHESTSTPSSSTTYYVYLSNSRIAGGYKLRMSATAPSSVNGLRVLGSGQNALHWLYVGTATLNGSTQFSVICGKNNAAQSHMEAATNDALMVTPSVMKFHPGVAKAWCTFHWSGAAIVVDASYNVSSITRASAGDYTINFDVDFSSANYCWAGGVAYNGELVILQESVLTARSASAIRIISVDTGSTGNDSSYINLVFFGDQ